MIIVDLWWYQKHEHIVKIKSSNLLNNDIKFTKFELYIEKIHLI